jgi:hypothetical protein
VHELPLVLRETLMVEVGSKVAGTRAHARWCAPHISGRRACPTAKQALTSSAAAWQAHEGQSSSERVIHAMTHLSLAATRFSSISPVSRRALRSPRMPSLRWYSFSVLLCGHRERRDTCATISECVCMCMRVDVHECDGVCMSVRMGASIMCVCACVCVCV